MVLCFNLTPLSRWPSCPKSKHFYSFFGWPMEIQYGCSRPILVAGATYSAITAMGIFSNCCIDHTPACVDEARSQSRTSINQDCAVFAEEIEQLSSRIHSNERISHVDLLNSTSEKKSQFPRGTPKATTSSFTSAFYIGRLLRFSRTYLVAFEGKYLFLGE